MEFAKLAARTRKRVQQTSLAPLMPPDQRTKARYMNVDILIGWGTRILTFLYDRHKQEKGKFDPEQLEEKLGWVTGFDQQLKEWEELLRIIATTESFVRKQGLHHDSYLELNDLLAPMAHRQRTKRVRAQLLTFVAQESFKAKPNERLPGSSEVIESVLGKFKQMEQDQVKSGFTGLLLSVAAMVSTTTNQVVLKALETVPTKHVLAWCKKTLGQSVQAKRKEAFVPHDKTEQKPDQLKDVA